VLDAVVLEELLAVVGSHHDERAIEDALGVEALQQRRDRGVRGADLCLVADAQRLEARIAGPEAAGAQRGQARSHLLVQIERRRRRLGTEPCEEFFTGVVRRVRVQVVDVEREGPTPCLAHEPQGTLREPRALARQIRAQTQVLDFLEAARKSRVAQHHRVAEEAGPIARLAKPLAEMGRLRQRRRAPAAGATSGGKPPREERHDRLARVRRGGNRLLEDHGLLRQRVEMGRGRSRVPREAEVIRAQRIDQDENEVPALERRLRKGAIVAARQRREAGQHEGHGQTGCGGSARPAPGAASIGYIRHGGRT
jgi:hypothetical protein